MALSAGEASSSWPSGSTPKWNYQVFLSFRGEDTRRGFTDHLYAALQRRGITTFRDDPELERGEVISLELLRAIEGSMSAIIIISPNYAFSSWCLDELQKIVECRKILGLSLFPVFYGMDPSDVRHQRGKFEEAFRMHEEKFGGDKEKLQRWRDALREVADIAGWDSKDWHEAELIECIVEKVQSRLQPKLPPYLDNLVGIDLRVEEVNSLLSIGSKEICFIGIWGMGGIGKTTIARALYERIKDEFEVSSFLANVREVCETNGLVSLQRQLLSRLQIRGTDIYDLYEGRKTLRNQLCKKKVLLVLDDVTELSHLENLAGNQGWFGPGSRVVVTTRDAHLLTTHGVCKIYKVCELNPKEALELFCLKAFKTSQPEQGYLDLSKDVIRYAGGLPLGLEVLGSFLCGRSLTTWHSALKQLESVPNPKIQDTLKISYDGLQPMEKNMFLDIACFFKGMDKDQVTELLENCGQFPQIGIEILIEKCLVTLDPGHNRLWMHDLLEEMGRNIVFQESPCNPGRRSRLWSQSDIDYVLAKNQGTEAIQGIVLDLSQQYEACWSPDAFSKTGQLKLLKLCNIQLPHGLNCLPSTLKVLEWTGFPLKALPLTTQLEELVDLKMLHSEIQQLWIGTEFMRNLKFIDLSFSTKLTQCPDISGVPNLERLVFEGCTSLAEVHESLGLHKKLILVNFKDCRSLHTLPSKMEMSSMEDLILSGCSKVTKLSEFGESMESLTRLSLRGTSITKLPSSLGSLVGLTVLSLKDCKNLVCLPSTISSLKSLRVLNVSGCSKLSRLPENLKEVLSLETLDASETAIEELPSSIFYLQGLKILSFAGCKGPVSKSGNLLFPFNWLFSSHPAPMSFGLPPSISSLYSLKTLNLSYCNLSEESIPNDFDRLSSLRRLDLTGNNFVTIPSSISKLSTLTYLCLNWCRSLRLLPELPSAIQLLDASNCPSLEVSKFNPSMPCNLFASTVQSSFCLPSVIENFLQSVCLPKARFDMLITGSEIPSWFVPQRAVSFAKIVVPYNCPPTEWVGFALCFLLVSYADSPNVCRHEIECYMFGPNGKRFVCSRDLPFMEPYYPHLYMVYLSADKYRDRAYEDGNCSEIEFVLKRYCCYSLEIVRCGCRLVTKQDVEDWSKAVGQ